MFRASLLMILAMVCGCRDERVATPATAAPRAVAPPATTRSAEAEGPNPMLEAEEVVRAVTHALGRNDTPAKDAGITTAFAFASPGNKQMTGPLARFVPMVKSPSYKPLLDYATIDYAPIRIEGDYAEQLITVTDAAGEAAAFLFILSRQREGEYEDCWMTDGVSRLGVEPIPPPLQQRREQETPEIRI